MTLSIPSILLHPTSCPGSNALAVVREVLRPRPGHDYLAAERLVSPWGRSVYFEIIKDVFMLTVPLHVLQLIAVALVLLFAFYRRSSLLEQGRSGCSDVGRAALTSAFALLRTLLAPTLLGLFYHLTSPLPYFSHPSFALLLFSAAALAGLGPRPLALYDLSLGLSVVLVLILVLLPSNLCGLLFLLSWHLAAALTGSPFLAALLPLSLVLLRPH